MAIELTGNVAGMLKLLGGGSDVEITQLLTKGTAIAIIKVDDDSITLYAPEGGGSGSNVEITPIVTSGTKIADVSINGVEKDLYCPTVTPTQVTVTQELTEGTKIGSINVNGNSTDLFAPEGGESSPNYSTNEHVVCKWVDGITDVYEKVIELSNISYAAGSINIIDNTMNTNNISHLMVIFATYIDDDFNHRTVSITGGSVELYISGAGLCVRNNSQIRIRGLYTCIRYIKL